MKIIFSFILRIVAVYFYGDTTIEYEWETLLKNLNEHGVLSLYSFDGKQIPSVFMPPLYILFLFILSFFSPENIELAKIVLAVQIILSTLSIFIFYKLCTIFFSKNWSIFISLLLSIFPLNIYRFFCILNNRSLILKQVFFWNYLCIGLFKIIKYSM